MRTEPVELTNMTMILDPKSQQVLVEYRRDPHWPGIAFPGGHVEPHESVTHSAQREVKEETGLTVTNLQLAGLKQYPLEPRGRFICFLYRTTQFQGNLQSSAEGPVFWMKLQDFYQNPQLAEGMEDLLNIMVTDFNEVIYQGEQTYFF
ncbi:NUDIX domain-containing protein [Bombilactobacillus folatiphilus]|uniref:NUDIX domain-containing protein n=1 Tax=Bombilactobacillus folatiphilus TaxID=2923362 RepID=A0ABY4P8R6_9LACO|nr:NUDIX domain-containing protein [Bombilactobacillus folatiphilus]UQS82108.1 NUDIX domain-containing protein [Bombilactobacillus folatiphilus]